MWRERDVRGTTSEKVLLFQQRQRPWGKHPCGGNSKCEASLLVGIQFWLLQAVTKLQKPRLRLGFGHVELVGGDRGGICEVLGARGQISRVLGSSPRAMWSQHRGAV